jgi:hypothetical protein
MAKLIYSAIMSLDGYVADEDGNFDWAGGTTALPHHVRLNLNLVDEHRFGNGVVYLRYRSE